MTIIRLLGTLALFMTICPALSFSRKVPDETHVITPNCANEAVLPCTAKSYSHEYTSIIWYKVIQNKDSGIILKHKGSESAVAYRDYAHVASLREDYSLVLKNLSLKDSGEYKCMMRARLGVINNDSHVLLNVSECVSTSQTPVLTPEFTAQFTTDWLNSSVNSVPAAAAAAAVQVVDVSALWAFIAFITISLTKLLLCALCLWGVVLFKKHRRKSTWS
ncbi:leucine-rich repeat-containing protein 24-like [Astyanax mexicanus]|uniref:Leucine-rich repeat-containing protein 24-like n=1 Tax=Astyanax mexicanus TaxID=7994 RepID=A0A8T2LMD5_ASTMX|nr:leucine-rich repeat-containing protein 24-like [Astyanax mexicanus]